ncbi:hypothetical protein Tco_0265252 [Tanacetum coccineum]
MNWLKDYKQRIKKGLSVKEKENLFQQLLEKRRKHLAAKRAEEQRNKPPTQVQQRKIMCTYLKNMEGKKLKDLKNKYFDSIQKMFDRAFKRVNTFFNFKTDLVEGSSKRAREELEQASTKRQKVDDDKETAELQSLIEVILDEEEGRIVRIKSLLNVASITAALIDVNDAQSKLMKLLLLEEVTTASGRVNAASEEVSTAELVSTAYVILVPTTLSIAWKVSSKLVLTTHLRVRMKWELERALLDFDSNQEKRLSHLRTQLGQQQDDMIRKINLLWKTVSEKLNDVSTPKNAGNSMAPKSIATISHVKREELRKKGIKSPSKLKDSDPKEEDVSSTNSHEHNLGSMAISKEEGEMKTNEEVEELFEDKESEMEIEEEVKEVFDDETEEEEDDDTKYYNSPPLLKNLYIMNEDTTSVIDGCLGEFVFGKPFIEETGLVYNKEEGTITTDSIPSPAYEESVSHGRMHYHQSLLIGDEYKHDGGEKRGIRHLMRLEKEIMVGKDKVTYLAFVRHLEEVHVTWAHLEKKRTRLQTNTKTLKDLCSQSLETASPTLHDAIITHLVMASQHFIMASAS